MHRRNRPRKLESSASGSFSVMGGEGSVHVCRKCRWPFSNSHPSQKKRAAHKKQCGKIDGYPLVVSESDGDDRSFGNCSGRSFVSMNVEEGSGFGEERNPKKFGDKKDTVTRSYSLEEEEEEVNQSRRNSCGDFSQESSSTTTTTTTSKLVDQKDTSSNGNKNMIKHEDVVAKKLDINRKTDLEKNKVNGKTENPSSSSPIIEVQQFDEELIEPAETLFICADVERSKKSEGLSEIHEMKMSKVDTKSIELEGDKNGIHSDEIGSTVAASVNDGKNSSSETNLLTVDELPDSSLTLLRPSKDSDGSEQDLQLSVENAITVENEAGISFPIKATESIEDANGNQENVFSSICDPPAEIIQINNDYRSESSTSQDDNPLPQNNDLETQGRKVKEEIKTRAVNWQNVRDGIVAESKKSQIHQKNQSEIFSAPTEISEVKTKTSSIKESLRSRLLPDAKKTQKEWSSSSPSKLPLNKNNKGKTRGKPQWTPFMCCPTTVK